MKEVEIFIRVNQTPPSTQGKALILMRYGSKTKEIAVCPLGSTPNRSVLLLSTVAVGMLKFPCKIKLHLQNNVGFAYMSSRSHKKWTNRDVGTILMEAVKKGGHEIEFVDCSQTKEGKTFQNSLANKIQYMFT